MSFVNFEYVLTYTVYIPVIASKMPKVRFWDQARTSMALIQVSQISFESEVCVVKWRNFHSKTVNEWYISTDMKLIFGQLITHDKMKLVIIFVAMLIL